MLCSRSRLQSLPTNEDKRTEFISSCRCSVITNSKHQLETFSRHSQWITCPEMKRVLTKSYCLKDITMEECQLDENFEDRLRWVDEEFYGSSSPTDDIWDKFELNTPPMSPEHECFADSPSKDLNVWFGDSLDSNLDQEIVNTILELTEKDDGKSKNTSSCEQFCGPLNTKIIQDCMWSASPSLPVDGVTNLSSKTAESSASNSNISSPARNRTLSVSGDCPKSSECVDPTAVFPYPLTATPIKSSSSLDSRICLDTPSPSESEDEEEIDVVTVGEKVACNRRRVQESSNSQYTCPVTTMHNYSNTAQIRAAHNHDHHYSAPHSAPQSPHIHSNPTGGVSVLKRSRPMSMPTSPQPPSKRHRSGVNESDLKRVVQKLGLHSHHSHRHGIRSARSSAASSRNNSDSEEGEGKRAQHNVLERKRRNDLKYSFCRLRACVPEIRSSERAPKVVILKKASLYVQQLGKKQKALETEHDNCKRLNEQLKKKLALLRKSDLSFM